MEKTVGIVHPGQMGVSIASALNINGHQVYWASHGRSAKTRSRAREHNLTDVKTLDALCQKCDLLLSVCPPDQALTVAKLVTENQFSGVYVDCNAVSPDTTSAVGTIITDRGNEFVDGGIIGPPAWTPDTTRLYLSGKMAADVAAIFTSSPLEGIVLGDVPGAASALKMAYAGWTKGSAALLLNMFALAESFGLGNALRQEWALSQPELENKLNSAAIGNAPKAWRFVGEMQEIAASLESADLPSGALFAASEVYQSMACFKDSSNASIDDVVLKLLDYSGRKSQ